jgi:alcohol dehydrogenase
VKARVMTAVKEPLKEREVPDPQPGPGQVRIRLHATGVCGTDVHVLEGELPVPLPIVLGHEPAGIVDAVGPGVRFVEVGDRVGVSWYQAGCGRCRYCQRKQIKFCAEPKTWITNGGGYADYMIAEAEGCTLLPDGVSWEQAAPLFCGGISAMSAFNVARPRVGDRVAVIGFGGLGHLAVQVAKAMGHDVVVITNTEDKRRDAISMGADVLVINNDAGKELLDMGGADIILSFSPSMKQNSQALAGLRPGGRFVTTAVGLEPIQVDPVQTLFKQISLIGSTHNQPGDVTQILDLVNTGKVKSQLEVYPMEQINHVLERLSAGKVRHRAVMTQE